MLDAKDVDVNDAERTWIVACTKRKQLETWLRRAATAKKASDLFD